MTLGACVRLLVAVLGAHASIERRSSIVDRCWLIVGVFNARLTFFDGGQAARPAGLHACQPARVLGIGLSHSLEFPQFLNPIQGASHSFDADNGIAFCNLTIDCTGMICSSAFVVLGTTI